MDKRAGGLAGVLLRQAGSRNTFFTWDPGKDLLLLSQRSWPEEKGHLFGDLGSHFLGCNPPLRERESRRRDDENPIQFHEES